MAEKVKEKNKVKLKRKIDSINKYYE